MDWLFILKQALNGFSLVLFLILIATGLTVIFGIMRVINMAHGELMMIGAYTVYATQAAGYNFLLGLILAPIVAGSVGILMERSVIRFLYGRGDLSTLLATWGFSLLFQQVVKLIFGPQPARVPSPLPGSFHFFGITYPQYRFVSMLVCLFIIIAVMFLFFKTNYGVMARATIQKREMSEVLGINTKKMYMFAFGFGSALAGVSGALIAPLIGVIPTMGLDYIARAFFIVIVGGMGSIAGVLGSGFILGETEIIITAISNGTVAQILVFIVVIVLMLIKPRGLFSK
jgi:urea ABC transporter permease protein UrtB